MSERQKTHTFSKARVRQIVNGPNCPKYVWLCPNSKTHTVEPGYNEPTGDQPNLVVKSRVCYIQNLNITKFRGNDPNVRYIKVIVNDWFVT